MKSLSKKELAALAMHEIMKREQSKYQERINEQQRISLLSDESLQKMVEES